MQMAPATPPASVCGSCSDPDDNEAGYHVSHVTDRQSYRVVRVGDESPWLRLRMFFESDDSQPQNLFIRTRSKWLRRFWSGLVRVLFNLKTVGFIISDLYIYTHYAIKTCLSSSSFPRCIFQ